MDLGKSSKRFFGKNIGSPKAPLDSVRGIALCAGVHEPIRSRHGFNVRIKSPTSKIIV